MDWSWFWSELKGWRSLIGAVFGFGALTCGLAFVVNVALVTIFF